MTDKEMVEHIVREIAKSFSGEKARKIGQMKQFGSMPLLSPVSVKIKRLRRLTTLSLNSNPSMSKFWICGHG